MGWVRLDDAFADHPKIIGLTDAAFRAHITAIGYSNRHLTDGRLTAGALNLIAGRRGRRIAGELVEAGLWHQNGTGYVIHDYLEFQPAAADILRRREANTERVQRWRQRQSQSPPGNAVGNPVGNAVGNAAPNPTQKINPPKPPRKRGGQASRGKRTPKPADPPPPNAAAYSPPDLDPAENPAPLAENVERILDRLAPEKQEDTTP